MTNDWEQRSDDLAAAGSNPPLADETPELVSTHAVPFALTAHSWDPPDPATIVEPGFTAGNVAAGNVTAGNWVPFGDVASTAPTYRRPRRGSWLVAAAAIAVLAVGGVGALQLHANSATSTTEQVIAGAPPVAGTNGGGTNGGGTIGGGTDGGSQSLPLDPGQGFGFVPGNGFRTDPFGNANPGGVGGQGNSTSQVTAKATTAQQVGVVDINTVLGLQNAKAAGTGMILTASGEILTNNHVINGATSISVTVVATGKVYKADVVGYSATQDIAVLQLVGASGLDTVSINTALPALGAAVTGVGNAGGVGGVPSAAPGKVVAVNQSITAADDNGASAEQLTGLIQTDSAIAAGDSGGPLFDSSNAVIGMDTAASTRGATQAFAIPMSRALAVANQIESGKASDSVHIGATGYLGVQVADQAGALVAGVIADSPAAKAGLVTGDVITSVNGHAVTSATALTQDMSALAAGATPRIGWTDAAGAKHSAAITLAAGPAR